MLVAGVSAGGTLALDFMQRHPDVPTLVDSPNVCVDTLRQSSRRRAYVHRFDVNIASADFSITAFEGQGRASQTSASGAVALPDAARSRFHRAPADAQLLLRSDAESGRRGNLTFCRDAFGIHAFSLTATGGCVDVVSDWMHDAGVIVERERLFEELFVFEPRQLGAYLVQEAAARLGMWDMLCRQLRALRAHEPFNAYAFGCTPSAAYDQFDES